MKGALSGLKVVDLSDSIAGQYCSRLLSDYGADVWIVEPGDGSWIRRAAPLSVQGDSLLFRHLNSGKYSIRSEDPESILFSPEVLSGVDVVVHSNAKAYTAVAAQCVGMIWVRVCEFGEDGPLANWQGPEIVLQALSGMMHNNGVFGREPLYGVGNRGSYAAGVAAYIGALTALYERGSSGRGQMVSVDAAETAAAMSYPYVVRYFYNGAVSSRSHQVTPTAYVKCRGEWVCIWIYDHKFSAAMAALELPELEQDVRFVDPLVRRQNWAEMVDAIQRRVKDMPADDLVDLLQCCQIISAKSQKASTLIHNAHLKYRGFWETVGKRTILGPPFRMSKTPRRVRAGGPALGEDGSLLQWKCDGRQPSESNTTKQGRRPLGGLRVVELTTAWAGPMAGRVLAFFGAEAIHVEAPGRANSWRLTQEKNNPVNFPEHTPGSRPFDRVFLFNSQNINKRSCILDLKDSTGRRALEKLLSKSDILICNFRPGTLARLGLGYEALKKIKPDIIVAELPAYGLDGPMSSYAALGPTMEMAAGMAEMIGYRDGDPETTGPSYMDPIGGFNTCAAIVTALIHRQRTGEGQHVEVPQVEAAMHFVGAELLAGIESGVDRPRNGNRVSSSAPHDAYPALGDDQWVVIAPQDDLQFQTLCRVMGRESVAKDPRYATLTGRLENADTLDVEISTWTRSLDKHTVAQLLQENGVAAAPVATVLDVAESEYLAARGFFTELDHPVAGTHQYPGLPIHLSLTPGKQLTAAPSFGEDNLYVVENLLGLDSTERSATISAMSTAPQATTKEE